MELGLKIAFFLPRHHYRTRYARATNLMSRAEKCFILTLDAQIAIPH